jgi:tRNA U34 5-carboxymethylaminomethyl modifying GTPase MnmE/TrmE
VDLLRGPLPPGPDGRPVELVDLPGIHDFRGSSEDEAIVQRFLRTTPPDLVVVVLNASQVVAQLRLLLQVRALGLPTVVALNMSDEARRWGVRIDSAGLARRLELPVVPISALRREGIGSLLAPQHELRQAVGEVQDPPRLAAAQHRHHLPGPQTQGQQPLPQLRIGRQVFDAQRPDHGRAGQIGSHRARGWGGSNLGSRPRLLP